MKIRNGLAFVTLLYSMNAFASNWVELNVLVNDEAGIPVEDVAVRGFFITDGLKNVERDSHSDVTNVDGEARLAGKEEIYVDLETGKPNFYQSKRRQVVNQQKSATVKIVLRPKRNPIPMWAKTVVVNARPDLGRENGVQFGYDFVAGDFVSPNGSGSVSDLLITHSYDKIDSETYSFNIQVGFSNPGDGLIPFYIEERFRDSAYRSAYHAPEEGYENVLNLYKARDAEAGTDLGNLDSQRNYYFRVRTVTNEHGEIISAHYGKIYGEFPSIVYYMNPTPNDRNLEFQPGRNLHKNLGFLEKVKRP